MQSLRERAAHRNIDLLKTAADAEHRNACADRARDERQCRCITRGIVQRAGNARAAIVSAWLHI